ncbi:PPOX class F420-dependent oxidoreductase [Actinoallomurus bryophytorum]|uniref:PPOX class probable F420-dependent enzyme n=1 Tax=Actinoallomurus bryophytorum TaxID=1490222 RepID=A0A543BSX6_9ACTN|nr:PPOX class F420-dependent oxidoreductase [Actinoallomurus bryophytorum]TQL87944.1 PPOX class probable F420-dependent enzyme [Actinoallomurus bryophytorum]
MAQTMTTAEWQEFVSSGTRTGKAAVTSADGAPHVTPIWFLLDGDDLVFTTHESSVKGKALRRDPRVCVCVDDDTPPYAFVSLWGEASLSEELPELRRWATDLGRRYMGADQAEDFGARNAVPGELLVRVRITKVVATRDLAD